MPGHRLKEGQVKNKSLFSKYRCPSCSLVLRDAVQPPCGHWLCESCILELFKQDIPVCPKQECQEPYLDDDDSDDEPMYFPDRFVRREISKMSILCEWHQRGCSWEGKLQEYDAHIQICECKVVECGITKKHKDMTMFMVELQRGIRSLQQAFSAMNSWQQWHVDKSITNPLERPPKSLFDEEDQGGISRSSFLFGSPVVPSSQEANDDRDAELKRIKALIKELKCEDRDFIMSPIENSNYDGMIVWKIPQFSQRTSDAHSGKYTSIFSLPFYTSRYGYKMCLRLYILGDGMGKNDHMSLFFVVMKGEFDNILHWPFTHKVTFRLINQCGNRDVIDTFQPEPISSSFRKPKSDMNIASGCPKFISHTDLKTKGFVVDDTIFIKCEVDTKGI